MIQQITLDNLAGVTSELEALNVTLMARPGTVLGELVRLSAPITTDESNVLMSVMQVTADSVDDVSPHSLELNGIVDDLSKVVTSHIAFVRNDVKPLFVSFAETLKCQMESASANDPSSQFNIVKLYLPELLKDESFLDSLSVYEKRPVLTPSSKISFDVKTHEELVSMLTTGHDRTNKLLGEWLSNLPEDELEKVWYSFFCLNTNPNGIGLYDYGVIGAMNYYQKASIGLLVYLFSKYLLVNVDSKDNVNLTTYKDVVTQLRDYAGSLIYSSIIPIAGLNKNKILVLSNNSAKKELLVNGDIYTEWLEAGGEPETLLGLIVSGERLSSTVMIDQKSQDLKRQWNSFCSYNSVYQENRKFDNFKSAVKLIFNNSLNESCKVEEDYKLKNPEYISTVKKLVDQEVDSFKISDMNDIETVALRIVAKCRFYYTGAFDILSDIINAARHNPDVDPREAALLATINYITDYLSDQIVIAK